MATATGHSQLAELLTSAAHAGGFDSDRFIFNTFQDDSSTTVADPTHSSGSDNPVFLDYFIFAVFVGVGAATGTFEANAEGVAMHTTDRVILETDTGKLSYDADGSNPGASVPLVSIGDHPWLTALSNLFAADVFQV